MHEFHTDRFRCCVVAVDRRSENGSHIFWPRLNQQIASAFVNEYRQAFDGFKWICSRRFR